MSLFASLGVGARGLAASQLGIDVTGQNITNANTEGYSRKRIDLSAGVRKDDLYGQMGYGVEVTAVRRVRDQFIDQQISEQASEKGYYSMLDEALDRLEGILSEPTEDGLNETMDRFWNAWQDLANNPSDLSARQALRSSAETLTDHFHSVSQELEDYRFSKNDVIDKKVEEVNSLTARIAALNEEVATMELKEGQNANDSRDRRDLLVKELSRYLDLQVVEDGNGRISVTSSGSLIVGPASSSTLVAQRVPTEMPDGTLENRTLLSFTGSPKTFVPRGGELRGLIEVKENIAPRFQGYLDDLARNMVESVNALHQDGFSLNRTTGVHFFDATKVKALDISISAAVKEDPANIAAASGGISVASPAVAFATPDPSDPSLDLRTLDSDYQNLVGGTLQLRRADGTLLREGAGKDYYVDYARGVITFTGYTTFSTGDPLTATFRYLENGFPGNGDGSLALKIGGLRKEQTLNPNGTSASPTQSMAEYYSSFIGTLGIERNQVKSQLETRDFLVKQLEGRQSEVAGVSIDEEMTHMIQYEHSYQASARYISTINQMLDTLMTML